MDVSPANQALAENLRRLMEETDLTQMGVEARSGVKQTTISLYLRPGARAQGKDGKAGSAKLTEVDQLAKSFGLEAWELLRPYSANEFIARDEIERQLLTFFRGLPESERDTVLAMVNGLANKFHPQPGKATAADPFPNVPPPPTMSPPPKPGSKAKAKGKADADH